MLDLVGGNWGPRPYAEVCACLPPKKLLRVGDQLVHVEQAGQGEPVVLLHGFGGSSWSWRHLMPALARRHRVIAPDLNGFGWTQRPREVAAYSYAGQAAMVLGVLRELGVERFHVIGHSYGGGLALWLAARHPERVRSLVLVSSVLPTTATSSARPGLASAASTGCWSTSSCCRGRQCAGPSSSASTTAAW